MTVSHSDLPVALRTAHSALFERAFTAESALDGFRNVTTVVNLTGNDRETYHWMGTSPEFVNVDNDEVTFSGLEKYELTIVSHLYKNGLNVQRRALEDDKLGLISPRISQLGTAAERFMGATLLAQLNDNPNAYDGTALFADTRTIGDSANIDNNITEAAASGTTPTVAEMQSAISSARSQMAAFQDDRGRVQNMTPNAIIYPAAVEQTLFQAMSGAQTPGSTSLVIPAGNGNMSVMNGYTLLRNPASDNDAEMYFANTMDVVSPLILQQRTMPTLESQTSATSDAAMVEDAFRYTARMRFGVGVGEPKNIIKLTFT